MVISSAGEREVMAWMGTGFLPEGMLVAPPQAVSGVHGLAPQGR